MAETPKIAVDLVDAAKDKKTLPMDASDFADALDKNEAVRERAQATLKTKEEWEALKATIDLEKSEAENVDVLEDEGGKRGLEAIERDIDRALKTPPPTVKDIKVPDREKPGVVSAAKNFLKGVGVGTIGLVVRTWIAVQRMLIQFGLSRGSQEQLNNLENLYGTWFGGAEAREQVAGVLKESGIATREGNFDGLAYAKLKTRYRQKMNGLLRVGADGKSPLSPEEQAFHQQHYTFQKFLGEEAAAYAAKHGGKDAAKGKERATTLMGVFDDAEPVETDAEGAIELKDGERLAIDARDAGKDGADLFGTFLDSKEKQADVTLDEGLTVSVLDPTAGPEGGLSLRLGLDGHTYAVSADMAGTPFEEKPGPSPWSIDGWKKAANDRMPPALKLRLARSLGLTVRKKGGTIEINVPSHGLLAIDVASVTSIARELTAKPGEASLTRKAAFTLDGKKYEVPVTLAKI
jgi:hypothetical protein